MKELTFFAQEMCIYPQWFTFSVVRKNKHTDKQRNKHTFETKEKEKQTETETKLEII